MNRLNGWQRIWVVLSVFWALTLVIMQHPPNDVWHSIDFFQKPVYATASSAVLGRMSVRSSELSDCNAPQILRLEDVTGLSGLTYPVRLCFAVHHDNNIATDTPDEADVQRIKADYKRAYDEELQYLRRQYYQKLMLVGTAPMFVLYALGWAVGWIRRGFRRV